MYNASVAATLGKIYGTLIPHMRKLEATLGRPLTTPLSDRDSTLLMVYLLEKGLSASTTQTYLSGAQWLALSQGKHRPPSQLDLSKTILKGHENLKRNLIRAFEEHTHRPVSIPLLQLLKYVASSFWRQTRMTSNASGR